MSAHESLPPFTITLFFSSSVQWARLIHVLGSFRDDLEARNNNNNVPRRHQGKQTEDNIKQKTPFRFHLHTRYSQDARAVVSAILLLRLQLLPSRSCAAVSPPCTCINSVCAPCFGYAKVCVCVYVCVCVCARAALFERARRNLRQMWYTSSGTQTPPTPGVSSARPSAGVFAGTLPRAGKERG